MSEAIVRDAEDADLEAIVRLNADEVAWTSPMDCERARHLARLACALRVACVADRVAGFLLAMREGCAYDSPNYAWFSARYPRFVYVDRVVVARPFARRGVGRALYADLFATAAGPGSGPVACELDLEPPNLASIAFHDRHGFHEVGTQRVGPRGKLVSMRLREPP